MLLSGVVNNASQSECFRFCFTCRQLGISIFYPQSRNCCQDPGRVVSAALYLDTFPPLSLLCLRICLQLKQRTTKNLSKYLLERFFLDGECFFISPRHSFFEVSLESPHQKGCHRRGSGVILLCRRSSILHPWSLFPQLPSGYHPDS